MGVRRYKYIGLLLLWQLLSGCADFALEPGDPDTAPSEPHSPARSEESGSAPASRSSESALCPDPRYRFPDRVLENPGALTLFRFTNTQPAEFALDLRSDLSDRLIPLDLVIAVDTTSSMSLETNVIREQIGMIRDRLLQKVPSAAIGIVRFEDFESYPLGRTGDQPYELIVPLTSDPKRLTEGTKSLAQLRNGGDIPESSVEMMARVATDSRIGWRQNSQRILVVITDAPMRDPGGRLKAPIADWTRPQFNPVGLDRNGYLLDQFPELPELTARPSSVPAATSIDALVALQAARIRVVGIVPELEPQVAPETWDEYTLAMNALAIQDLSNFAVATGGVTRIDIPKLGLHARAPLVLRSQRGSSTDFSQALMGLIEEVHSIYRYRVEINYLPPELAAAGGTEKSLPIDSVRLTLLDAETPPNSVSMTTAEKRIVGPTKSAQLRFRLSHEIDSCLNQQFAFEVKIQPVPHERLIYVRDPESNSLVQVAAEDGLPHTEPEITRWVGVEIIASTSDPASPSPWREEGRE